jgi:hypothetical protein
LIATLLSFFSLHAQGQTEGQTQELLQSLADKKFTGFVHASLGDDATLVIFFEGRRIDVYKITNQSYSVVESLKQNDVISGLHGNIRIGAMPGAGLRVLRLLMESTQDTGVPKEIVSAARVLDRMKSLQNGEAKLGVAVNNEGAFAVLVLNTSAKFFSEGMIASASSAYVNDEVLNQIFNWRDQSCSIYMYKPKDGSDAWRELELRTALENFLKYSLDRYKQIAGLFLLSDLAAQINQIFKGQGLSLTLNGSTFSNFQFFGQLDAAMLTYIRLLDIIDNQLVMVIGDKMANQVWLDGFSKISAPNKNVLSEQVFKKTNLKRVPAWPVD